MPEIFHPYASFALQQRMPMRFEADVFDCEVIGEIPAELQGGYFRTGGDRLYPTLDDDIILNGDGLVSAFWFEDGHVSFRSRFVHLSFGSISRMGMSPAFVASSNRPTPRTSPHDWHLMKIRMFSGT